MNGYSDLKIIGNCGSEVTAQYTPTGDLVGKFSVAVNKSKEVGGEWKTKVTWYRVTVWGKKAEYAQKRVHKGALVLVSGELDADPETGGPHVWTGNDGVAKASYEMTASQIVYLEKAEKATTQPENDDFSD